MNNESLKKWMVLGALLLVTLVLVWNAPEPEPTEVVDASRSDRTSPQSLKQTASLQQREMAKELALKPRQSGVAKVDLFSTPKKPVRPKPVISKQPVIQPIEKSWELPFRYVGRLEKGQQSTFFLMEGTALYLVQQGDVISEQYRLQRIDDENLLLVWQHLPSNETRNMSIEK